MENPIEPMAQAQKSDMMLKKMEAKVREAQEGHIEALGWVNEALSELNALQEAHIQLLKEHNALLDYLEEKSFLEEVETDGDTIVWS